MVQQASLYAGGAMSESLGALGSVTYDGLREKVSIGNIEMRRIHNTYVNDENVLFGVTLHNVPGLQDPWGSTALRLWPHIASLTEPRPGHALALDGLLARRVVGMSASAFINDSLYLEAAAYRPLSDGLQRDLGVFESTAPNLDDTGLYLRLARERRVGTASLTLGAFMFRGDIALPGSSAVDTVTDYGVDAYYQVARGPHVYNLSANLMREDIDSADRQLLGMARSGSNHVTRLQASAQYFWDATVAIGLGYEGRSSSTDDLYFASPSGSVDTHALRIDLFVNPISKQPLDSYNLARTRFGLQYVHYFKFNGAGRSSNGLLRSARDNDTLTLYWAIVL